MVGAVVSCCRSGMPRRGGCSVVVPRGHCSGLSVSSACLSRRRGRRPEGGSTRVNLGPTSREFATTGTWPLPRTDAPWGCPSTRLCSLPSLLTPPVLLPFRRICLLSPDPARVERGGLVAWGRRVRGRAAWFFVERVVGALS